MTRIKLTFQKTTSKNGAGRSFISLSNGYVIYHHFNTKSSEYIVDCGKDIPYYKKLRFKSLDKLLKSFPIINTDEVISALKDTNDKIYSV